MDNELIDAATRLAIDNQHVIRLLNVLVRYGWRPGEVGRDLVERLRRMPAYMNLFKPEAK